MPSVKSQNDALDLSAKTAAVAGATQGIGAGIAVRFAALGANVLIVGRNAERAKQVLQECRAAARGSSETKIFDFVQADLSRVGDIIKAADELAAKAPDGIHYLVQTQGRVSWGGPATGRWTNTDDGRDSHFAVQCLSKFGIASILAQKGVLKEAALIVGAPGGGFRTFDGKDPELAGAHASGKFGFLKAFTRDSIVLDGITEELQSRHPSLRFYHVFPGFVATKAAANQGFPFPIPQISGLVGPILGRIPYIGNTPRTFADVPIYLMANPASRDQGRYSNWLLWNVKMNPWAESSDNRQDLWQSLQALLGARSSCENQDK